MKYILGGAFLGFILFRYSGVWIGAFIGYLVSETLSAPRSTGKAQTRRQSQSPMQNIQAKSDLENAYATLELPYNANFEDIRKAYRQKCKALHPDTLNSKNLNKTALSAIEKELRSVIEAYELILKSRSL